MKRLTLPLLRTAALLLLVLEVSAPAQLTGQGEAHAVAFQHPDADAGAIDDSADYDIFYDRLSRDGNWFYDDDYGYVWQPNVAVTNSSWRPYADGHWVWTDRGWCWVSNENFGWATYHYGRWIRVSDVGWVWVPGDEWAPAWVSWRHTDDDDYVGWAPLPPEASVTVNVGVQSWCDSYYDIGPAAFAFIRIGDFCRPSYREFFVPAQENFTIVNRTRNITNITYNNNVFYNYGPQYERVSQIMQRQGQQVPNYKISYTQQVDPKANFRTQPQGNQLNVIAPPQKLKAFAKAEPQVAKQLGKAPVDRGWHNVPPNQAQQMRQKLAQEAPVPKTLPFKAPLPAKPQIQAAKTNQQGQPGKPGTVPPGPAAQKKELNQKPPEQGKPANRAAEAQKGASEKAKTVQAEKGHPTEPTGKRPEAQEQKAEHPHPNATTNAQAAHHVENASKPHLEQKSHPAPQHIAEQPHPQAPHPQPQHVAQAPHPRAPHPQPQHVAQAPHPQAPHPQPQHVAQAPHPQAPHPQPQHAAQAPHPQPQNAKAESKGKKKEH